MTTSSAVEVTDDDLAEERLSGRSSEARAARTQRMIRAAIELAGQGGYEAVQVREVAARAKVALATFYRYYPSKKQLLLAAVTQPRGSALRGRRAVGSMSR